MEYGGRPYDPTVPGDQDRARLNPTGDAPPGSEFDAKLEKMADEIGDRAAGGYEPSIDGSPEAYADHILDVYLQNPPPPLDQMEDLEYVLTKPMYREQVKNAVLEYIGMMTESRKMKITKRQLRSIISEAISQHGNDDSVENHPKRDELMDALHKKYGLMSRTTEEFGTSPGGVWINAESNVPETEDGLPLFDYYLQVDPYMFGIHPDFEAFVIDNYGFAPEWNDPGTLMLWSLD